MRLIALVILFAFLIGTSFAVLEDVQVSLNRFCVGIKDMLPSAAMLMVVLGAVIYAAGQMMGAETRARANVWATAALTGALVAILIATITPVFLNQIYGAGVACIAPRLNCAAGNYECMCFSGGQYLNHNFCVPAQRATCTWAEETCHYA